MCEEHRSRVPPNHGKLGVQSNPSVTNPRPTPPSARRRVLIAEDDQDIARMLERVLSAHCQVLCASDGHDALRLAAQQSPQLLILDIMMPGLDGLSVARLARELPGMSHVPIVFLTAKDASQDVIKGIQSGARHYITKPFKIDDVVAKVKKILKI